MTTTKKKKMVSVRRAAAMLSACENTVRAYCNSRKLAATKAVNGRWSIEKESIMKLLEGGE